MRFREWLLTTEAAQQRSHITGNRDNTTNLGPTSQFGGPRTMLPVSWGIDNRAFAGVVDGIGTARAKVRADMGAEPGAASHYEPLQDMRRGNVQTLYLPLQLEKDYTDGEPVHLTKGLVAKIKSQFKDPLDDDGVYGVDEQMALVGGTPSQMMTKLYTTNRSEGHDPSKYEAAVNYTTALMQASISNKLGTYSHLINLERPSITQRKVMPLPMKEREGNEDVEKAYTDEENPEFYHVMMCAFLLNPKSKDNEFDGEIHSDIERLLHGSSHKDKKPSDSKNSQLDVLSGKTQRPTTEVPNPKK